MILIGFAVFLVLFILYFVYTTPHWHKFNIPYLKPNPFFGNLTDLVFQRRSLADIHKRIYEKFKNAAYVGIYVMRRPGILIRDLELVKDVMVKDFSNFHDNDLEVNPDLDPIFGNNPFTMKGEQWKTQRAKHTPLFTTGKVKNMFNDVVVSGDKLVKYVSEKISENSRLEAEDLTGRFTICNVGSCAMGIDNRIFEEDKSEMRQMGLDFVGISIGNSIKQILMIVIPSLFDFFGASLISPTITKRLKQIVVEQLDYRKRNNIERNDFLDNVRKIKEKDAPLIEVIAQVGGFFIDAFATSAHALNFTLYELAKNVDVQEKLRKEILETLDRNNGEITFEILSEMQYLEAVVLESLRKHPPLASLNKLCTKPYNLPPATPTSDPIKVEVGTVVVIPTLGIHYDEKYYKNPYEFDPTRFLPENKDKIPKYAYLAFGEGPRICIGKKFGLMQAKIFIFKLIQNYELRVNKKTKEPLFLHPGGILLTAKGGIWIDVTKI